jgi:hypothetical protein
MRNNLDKKEENIRFKTINIRCKSYIIWSLSPNILVLSLHRLQNEYERRTQVYVVRLILNSAAFSLHLGAIRRIFNSVSERMKGGGEFLLIPVAGFLPRSSVCLFLSR